MATLEREMATYRKHLGDLLNNEGRYIVVKEDEILPGAFPTMEAALEAGYERYGPGPFLVKQICRTEPVLYYSRDIC